MFVYQQLNVISNKDKEGQEERGIYLWIMILRFCDLMVEYEKKKLSEKDQMTTTALIKIAHPPKTANDLHILN